MIQPPAGECPLIAAIVVNLVFNNLIKNLFSKVQNSQTRSFVVFGAYSSEMSFPAEKIFFFSPDVIMTPLILHALIIQTKQS